VKGVREWRLSPEVRSRVVRMGVQGATYAEIVSATGVSTGSVANVLRSTLGGTLWRMEIGPSSGRLSLEDRVEIWAGLDRGESFASIARLLGWHPSTVSREVAHHGGRQGYRPVASHRAAMRATARPHCRKLDANPRLWAWVVARLRLEWSPQQIVRRLVEEFPDDAEMRVSHETIYQSLYVQGRGELRRELALCLRTGRAVRRQQRDRSLTGTGRGKIPGMVNISQRPPEVADRHVPGHWEGDLILGKNGRSAVGTLVERRTRFVMLLHLPNGRTAEAVRVAMAAKIVELPASLRRSITWDQGSEMAEHAQFSVDTDVDIYFCDPHSPWQRGSNENTNGLLRQYLPKGTDLSVHTATDLQRIADRLNGRPRQTLNWRTPAEALATVIDALDP
jgi:IS30 family transposase